MVSYECHQLFKKLLLNSGRCNSPNHERTWYSARCNFAPCPPNQCNCHFPPDNSAHPNGPGNGLRRRTFALSGCSLRSRTCIGPRNSRRAFRLRRWRNRKRRCSARFAVRTIFRWGTNTRRFRNFRSRKTRPRDFRSRGDRCISTLLVCNVLKM